MKTKKDFLKKLKEDIISKIAQTEVDIEMYSDLSEETVVGQDTSGSKPKDMTAKDALEIQNKNLIVYTNRLVAINKVLKRNSLF
jgi:hypothetical protein